MPDLPLLPEQITTERLILRPFTLEDAEACHPWFSDPEVMKFIPGGRDTTLADTQHRIQRYLDHGQRYGFTKWLITDRITGALLGDGGLYHLPDGDSRVELGFRLARPHWGQGYAAEMGRAWMDLFPRLCPGQPLHGIVMSTHRQSQKVLEKLGFELEGTEEIYGCEMRVYSARFAGGLEV